MLKIFRILSLFLWLILFSCEEGDAIINSKSSTEEQEEFIALLKNNYPTQVVNFITDTAISGAPYVKNQQITATFSSSGMLFLDTNPEKKDGDDIELPIFTIKGTEYVWTDTDHNLSYSLSLNADNFINELNVASTEGVFYNSLKEFSGVEAPKIHSFLLLPNNVECTHQTKNKIVSDQRLITMRTKFCGGSQKSLNFNFKADVDISIGTYAIQPTTTEEKNPEAGKVAIRLFIDGDNYYGLSGTVTIQTSSVLDTLINCVFEHLIVKNSEGTEIMISGQILDI